MSIVSRVESLRGRVAIITGASSGLGWATAKALAAEGVRIVGIARRADRLQALASEIAQSGGECAFMAGDAADVATAEASVKQALGTFGRLDILVNNAGQGKYKPLIETTPDDYDELMRSNMRSTFTFTRAVAPHFIAQRQGTLIFVSSIAGLVGAGNEAVYSASKFAQVGFAQSVDEELRPYGVKVCTFCPGGMKTEFAIGQGRTAEAVAASRMMDAVEVADAIVFACMQPLNVRIPQLTVRHMGSPK